MALISVSAHVKTAFISREQYSDLVFVYQFPVHLGPPRGRDALSVDHFDPAEMSIGLTSGVCSFRSSE